MKSIKKHKEQRKSGSSAKPSRPYVFHEQMSFLNKITEATIPHESCHNNEQEETALGDANDEASFEKSQSAQAEENRGDISKSGNTTSNSGTQRKRKTNVKYELDIKMMKFLDNQMHFSEVFYPPWHHLTMMKLCNFNPEF
jgi:hypothetical protein